MGLLDRFGKTKNEDKKKTIMGDARFGRTVDDRLQIDFHDNNADFKKLYDTTRLIIKEEPIDSLGQNVYNCIVSWYGENDHSEVNKVTGKFESPRANQYRGVLMQLDLNLLQNDPKYCEVVMKGLLDEKRVEKYLEMGLQDNPDTPCGKYIGGVMKTEKGYQKFFAESVGIASHNSKLMVDRRNAIKAKKEEAKQAQIKANEEMIEKLKAQNKELSI